MWKIAYQVWSLVRRLPRPLAERILAIVTATANGDKHAAKLETERLAHVLATDEIIRRELKRRKAKR